MVWVVAARAMTRKMRVTLSSRPQNWDVYASQYINAILGEPFVYGETDCVTIARRVLEATYGEDLTPFALTYKTTRGARSALKRHSIEQTLRDLGAQEVRRPRRYDFAIVHDVDGFQEGVSIVLANYTRLVTTVGGVVQRIPYEQGHPVHVLLRMPAHV